MKLFMKLCTIALLVLINLPGLANGAGQSQSFTFVQLCDVQLGYGESYAKDVNSFKLAVQRINEVKPDFVILCGDMVNTFDDKSLKDFNDVKSGLKVPLYCCPGNHDIGNEPNIVTLTKYRKALGKDYFSFEHKGYTFILTNTSLWKVNVPEESQKHDVWFKSTLKAAADKKSPVFFIGHYPLYVRSADEPNGYNPLPTAKRKELLDLSEKSGVVAILTGHLHSYINNDYKGIQLVSGESTSRNNDRRPFGFRLWTVQSPTSIKQDFVPLTPQTPVNNTPAR
jgi:serine/threonine-protein phosphatase CPPED1